MSGTRCRRTVILGLLASFLVVATCGQATGQAGRLEVVRLYGHVEWIAAEKMLMTTDCTLLEPCNPLSIAVDLRRISPSDYRGLRQGSRVIVEAVVSHENSRHHVTATSIIPVEEWEAP
jgi:hypothetical protein